MAVAAEPVQGVASGTVAREEVEGALLALGQEALVVLAGEEDEPRIVCGACATYDVGSPVEVRTGVR